MVFLIWADLSARPADSYADFEKTLKTLGNWAELGRGGWVLESERFSAAQLRDLLRPHVVAGQDRLFVARVTKNWAGLNMTPAFPDWLKRRTFEAPKG